jgi:hypothetical protein
MDAEHKSSSGKIRPFLNLHCPSMLPDRPRSPGGARLARLVFYHIFPMKKTAKAAAADRALRTAAGNNIIEGSRYHGGTMPATVDRSVSYKELGFVNTRQMFKDAMNDGYAVPAYNFNNMEQLQAILTACVRSRSPVILQISKGARDYANATLLRWMGRGAMEMIKEMKEGPVPVALHLDHGDTFELCKNCIDAGFSSVMIDGSSKSYEDNIKLTKQVVEYSHAHDVTVDSVPTRRSSDLLAFWS